MVAASRRSSCVLLEQCVSACVCVCALLALSLGFSLSAELEETREPTCVRTAYSSVDTVRLCTWKSMLSPSGIHSDRVTHYTHGRLMCMEILEYRSRWKMSKLPDNCFRFRKFPTRLNSSDLFIVIVLYSDNPRRLFLAQFWHEKKVN